MLLFACKQTGVKTPDISSIEVGTQALEMLFEKELPPKKIFEETPFTVLVNIYNKGTSEITNGVYVLGYENQYVDLEKNRGVLRIEGKTIDNPRGGFARIQLRGKTKSLGPQLEGLTTGLSFTACFPNKTSAGLTTCIDTKPEEQDKTKECKVIEKTYTGGQGAPITITKIEPLMIPVKNGVQPVFKISIKNIGKGQVLDLEYSGQYCLGRAIPKSAYNLVNAKVHLQEDELDCTKTQLKLTEQEESIICTSPKTFTKKEGTFSIPLSIELEYGYVQTITQDMRIESKY